MRHLNIILSLLIVASTTSWAQEDAEERLNKIVELQGQANELKILKQAWSAYKSGDHQAALGLWMPLAETGNPSAQVFMGLMYDQGNVVERDRKEAAKWYALASDQNHAPAKWRLAILYYHGSGLRQDYQKAANLYHSAAKQGDVYSQKALGVMYAEGLGVPQDNIIAYSWLHTASSNGFELALKFQNKIGEQMTPEETTIAAAMAKGCKQSNYAECGWELRSDNDPNKDEPD